MLIYSQTEISIISNSGKNETLRKCALPADVHNFRIQYDDNNWKKFYLQAKSKVYEFEYDEKLCQPNKWFQLESENDTFFVASTMLIVKSWKNQNYYFNLTTGAIELFELPYQPHDPLRNNTLSIVSKSVGSHIVCDI